MKILNYGRGQGKTVEAVEYAINNNCMLLVSNWMEKKLIKEDLLFEDVFTLEDVLKERHREKRYNCAVVDNLEFVLMELTKLEVELATITDTKVEKKKNLEKATYIYVDDGKIKLRELVIEDEYKVIKDVETNGISNRVFTNNLQMAADYLISLNKEFTVTSAYLEFEGNVDRYYQLDILLEVKDVQR